MSKRTSRKVKASSKVDLLQDKVASLKARFDEARKSAGKYLNLSNLQLTEIPQEVWSFPELETIDLANNKLRTITPRLRELHCLRSISLFGNPLVELPNIQGMFIDDDTYDRCRGQSHLSNVEALVIFRDRLEGNFWANASAELRRLRRLVISGPTSLKSIFDPLTPLDRFELLEELEIFNYQLFEVPASIQHLQNLKSLSLIRSALKVLPECLLRLNLESLRLTGNNLSAAGMASLSETPNRLKYLDLSYNPLGQIPDPIFDLTGLQSLRLIACRIVEVPARILQLTSLRSLSLDDNSIQSPPEEVVKQGLNAIRNYWRQREDTGVDYLCEAKLIILGESGAGKTSLAQKIKDPKYQLRVHEPTTEGIDIIRWEFPTVLRPKDTGSAEILPRSFQVNIWDFGGQEIYHATHQFFLTRRSVYVLVCDDRKEDTDFGYWLQVIETLSDASPLVIVQNEKQDRKRDINLNQLRAQFGNLRIAVSTNLDTNRGLDEVLKAVRSELEALPHIGIGLPVTWKRVREALEQDHRDHISLEQYLAICQEQGLTRQEDKLQVSSYLHDLGICLHFQNDPVLKSTVILKPSWARTPCTESLMTPVS